MSDDSGTTTGDGQQAGQQGDTGTGQAPAGTAPKPTPPAGQQPAEGDLASLPQWAQDTIKAARGEAGKARTTAKQAAADQARQELAQTIGKALGIVQDDEPADPEKLTQQLAAEQAKARQTAVELAVYRTARDAGADPDALLDSRQFAAAVADVDPSDTAAITAAIAAAVEVNPRLSAQQQPAGPARGGAEFSGPPSEGVTPAQFAAMDYAKRAELYQSDPDTYRRLAGS